MYFEVWEALLSICDVHVPSILLFFSLQFFSDQNTRMTEYVRLKITAQMKNVFLEFWKQTFRQNNPFSEPLGKQSDIHNYMKYSWGYIRNISFYSYIKIKKSTIQIFKLFFAVLKILVFHLKVDLLVLRFLHI